MPPRIGIVDSGVAPTHSQHLSAQTRVLLRADGGVERTAASDDTLGHGAEIARIILDLAPAARLVSAQAFADCRTVDAALVAAGIHWCLEQEVRIINLSLGIRSDVAVLRHACDLARAGGVLLVAASPARGGAVFPAAYSSVLAVTGDARCAATHCSVIAAGRLLGAATVAADGIAHGGASYAAARISGLGARFFSAWPDADARDCLAWLESAAKFFGRESRAA